MTLTVPLTPNPDHDPDDNPDPQVFSVAATCPKVSYTVLLLTGSQAYLHLALNLTHLALTKQNLPLPPTLIYWQRVPDLPKP